MRIHELLRESLMHLDEDVNMIYDKFFKDDIEEIQSTGFVNYDMFSESQINSSALVSTLSKRSHDVNPVNIIINKRNYDNVYSPTTKKISITVAWAAVQYVLWEFGGDLKKALNRVTPKMKKSLQQEFTEEKIKGSIHHELVHWIDDSVHNKHIEKRVQHSIKHKKPDLSRKGLPINVDKLEIQSQIHNVLQIKKKHHDLWDILSFDEMIGFSPALLQIFNSTPEPYLSQWKKALKKRMAREGLLGKEMR